MTWRFGIVKVLLLALVLVSCALPHKRWVVPMELPERFSVAGEAILEQAWWKTFHDAGLEQLMKRAFTGNFTLKSAWERLVQAEAVAKQSGASLLPEVDVSGSASRTTMDNPMGPDTTNKFSIGGTVSYEVDLWGRIRSTRDAARMDVMATREDIRSAAISLSAQVATAWYQLSAQVLMKELLEEEIQTNEKMLKLIDMKYRKGIVSITDVLQQRQLVESKRGEKVLMDMQIAALERQVEVLCGVPAGTLEFPEEYALPEMEPMPEAGIPSERLFQRPDVRSAYYRLGAANARVAAAVSRQFPRLSLSANVEASAYRARDIFDNWMRVLAGNLLAPVFDGGYRAADTRMAASKSRELFYAYRQTLLQALDEVEDAISAEVNQERYLESLERQLALSNSSMEQARNKYIHGSGDFLRYLNAVITSETLRMSYLKAKRERISARIQLCKALAGGFSLAFVRELTDHPREPNREYYYE